MKSGKLKFSILSAMVASSMVLAACDVGGGAATPTAVAPTATTSTAADPTNTTSAAGDPTNTTAPAMTPSGEGGTIKLVSSLPRTGLSKPQTDDIVAGFQMALAERNGKVGNFTIQ